MGRGTLTACLNNNCPSHGFTFCGLIQWAYKLFLFVIAGRDIVLWKQVGNNVSSCTGVGDGDAFLFLRKLWQLMCSFIDGFSQISAQRVSAENKFPGEWLNTQDVWLTCTQSRTWELTNTQPHTLTHRLKVELLGEFPQACYRQITKEPTQNVKHQKIRSVFHTPTASCN